MEKCPICNHTERQKIEQAFLNGATDSPEILEKIADDYKVSVDDLMRHMLFHTPKGEPATSDSLVRRLKVSEAELLGDVVKDFSATLQVVGKRLRDTASRDADDISFERTLTKPTVDLYLGCGDTLQKTVKAMADIEHLLNGPKDEGTAGLAALAAALNASRQVGQE